MEKMHKNIKVDFDQLTVGEAPVCRSFREGAPRFDDGLTGDSMSFW